MTPTRDFFPYHPLTWRRWLWAGAVGGLALTGWALAGAAESGAPLEFARTGVSAGLTLAMLAVQRKFRPRPDWGVKVTPLALVVSRPSTGALEVPWSEVTEIRRGGAQRETLLIFAGGERRVLVSQHLFPSREEFEALALAIDERRPSTAHDA